MSVQPLWMISLELDRLKIAALGRSFGLPLDAVDEGYLAHCVMRAMFADLAPQPFATRGGRGRTLRVLGYCSGSDEELRAKAEAFAEPLAYAACDFSAMAAKPMPRAWRPGMRLGFEVRVCPVSRLSASSTRPVDNGREPGETDCFLAACLAAGASTRVDREQVYLRWLGRELFRGGAARMLAGRMLSFRRVRLSRRDHGAGRRTIICERPDAVMTGSLEIADPASFDALLRRGIGRHRAFGFGMLLLKPPENYHA
jgi:CRISPR system Cascade subunit CasE